MKISYQTSWKGSNYHRRKITKPSFAMAKAWHYKRQLHLFMVGIWACLMPKLRVLLSQRHSTTVSLETKPSLNLLEHYDRRLIYKLVFFSLRNFSTNFSPRIISTKDTERTERKQYLQRGEIKIITSLTVLVLIVFKLAVFWSQFSVVAHVPSK